MKLYELFPNFLKLSFSERTKFIRTYRAKRALELEEGIKNKKKSSKVVLTEEEKALIKSLGITQKDLKALKEIL
jgi:hypothetical protein